MPVLEDFDQFQGLHWETGSVRNYFAYRGVVAPHTGQPFSEALLMGISGGAVMGYFSFAYEGYDPHVAILTRNTFDPLDTLLQRLGVPQHVLHTSLPAKALKNLIDTLENGTPAIVWADAFSLPYNQLPHDRGMWEMMPVLVYGYDESADRVWIADRARVPLSVATSELAEARGRVKKIKYRLLTLDPPNMDKLPGAVQLGIWDSIKLFTEAPPKGSKSNFGFTAYRRWADLLTRPTMRQSWAKVFPPGLAMYSGLTSAFNHIAIFGKDGGAERGMFADFLDEAAVLLGKPALQDTASQFRRSAQAWDELGAALLPDEVPPLRETRQLMLQKHRLFLDEGNEANEAIRENNVRLKGLRGEMEADFPLDEAGVDALCQKLRELILGICELEEQAIDGLRQAMS